MLLKFFNIPDKKSVGVVKQTFFPSKWLNAFSDTWIATWSWLRKTFKSLPSISNLYLGPSFWPHGPPFSSSSSLFCCASVTYGRRVRSIREREGEREEKKCQIWYAGNFRLKSTSSFFFVEGIVWIRLMGKRPIPKIWGFAKVECISVSLRFLLVGGLWMNRKQWQMFYWRENALRIIKSCLVPYITVNI